MSPRFALSGPSSLRLRIRPYNLRHLSDETAVLELPVGFGDGVDPAHGDARVDDEGASMTVTGLLQPDTLPDDCFIGGALRD